MKIAFDMPSVMKTCLYAGKDLEFGQEILHGEGKVWINGWQHGYENTVNKMVAAMSKFRLAPKDVIMVFEGKSAKKQRMMISPTYKAKKPGEEKPLEYYEQLQHLQDKLKQVFHDLGALAVQQDFVEADDILAWLAKNMEEDLVIATNDGDMLALVGTNEYGSQIHVLRDGELDINKYGAFDFQLIPVYKSLVGDSSDKIKGCPGFGDAKFLQFVQGYGEEGLYEILRLLEKNSLDELASNAEEDKLVKAIYTQREEVLKSYRLAKARPEWVNTLMHPLRFTPGIALPKPADPDERLSKWYATKFLVTGAKFDAAVAWARPFLEQSETVSLDIETSVPPESDEWLAAQSKTGKVEGVDVIGSKLTGLSLTFGANLEKSLYFAVDHADTDNCTSEQVKALVLSLEKPLVIQNAAGFELPVLLQEWGVLLPNCLDTRIEAAYVDENSEQGLKQCSKRWLNYEQTTYEEVTTIDGVQYKMNQLTGAHVMSYGCDDTITAAALHNFYKLHMQLDHHWDVYLDVEIDAMYAGAQAFVDGVNISMKRLSELVAEDNEMWAKAWAILREYLIAHNWPGSVPPVYTTEITAAQTKEAYELFTGEELDTKVRKIEKLAQACVEAGQPLFAAALLACVQTPAGAEAFTGLVRSRFTGEPAFKVNSPKQKAVVLYELLSLPVRLRGEVTDNMRAGGIKEGNPKTSALAMAYALKYDIASDSEIRPIIAALSAMQTVQTRRGLYWNTYANFIHWRTGKVHPSLRQSATNTRRHTSSKPNVQQVSKHPKAEGELPKVREVYVPHHPDAVIVSLDEAAQELRIIADYSRDENMLSCFIGDNKKDMHSLTGSGIIVTWGEGFGGWSYEVFIEALHAGNKQAKEARRLGKLVNFGSEFGAQAPKLAEMLIIPEEEAQLYLDAKMAAFPQAASWKQEVEEEVKHTGIVRTKGGAVRHLAEALMSDDRYEASKALRVAVNFKVQSSAAEMIKRAIGAVWRTGLRFKYDCRFLFPVHDELVFSCAIKDLYEFLPEVHACMVQPYGEMLVPIRSSIALGRSFGPEDQIEIGEEPTKEAIDAGLRELNERAISNEEKKPVGAAV